MKRREFLAASIATSAVALQEALPPGSVPSTREFYHLRRYNLKSGAQLKLTRVTLQMLSFWL